MIFYFTGSGNSLYAAKKIAGQEGGRLISIADARKNGEYIYAPEEGEAVGFVLPTYFFGLPTIVGDFLSKLELKNSANSYIYLVLTCGGTTANAGRALAGLLAERGYHLSASYGIATVDNYVPIFTIPEGKELESILLKAEARLEEIRGLIAARAQGDQDRCKGPVPALLSAVSYPLYRYGRKTRKFTVTEKCHSCGLCRDICPEQVIVMAKDRPTWSKPDCVLCFACLHRCPENAIRYGKKTAAHGRYVHPGSGL